MRAARRLSCVSSFFALITHQLDVLRYQGACDWKNFQATGFFRNCFSYFGGSWEPFRCS